jgi:hypothetical protein
MEIGFNGTDQRKAMETLESYSDEMTNDNLWFLATAKAEGHRWWWWWKGCLKPSVHLRSRHSC